MPSSGAVIPKMFKVRQSIKSKPLIDIEGTIASEFARFELQSEIQPGATVAIGCSSRGIANYGRIIGGLVRELQKAGLKPFLFPAMGSHGAATAAGQKRVVEDHGIDEDELGVEIRSSQETVVIGKTELGMPIYIDAIADTADFIIPVNRIKSHTEFSHSFESGVIKMLAIGMGKEQGATTYHRYIINHGYPAVLGGVTKHILASGKVLFGLGIVEDGNCETSQVEVLRPETMFEQEARLLEQSIDLSPKLPFDELDVLMIDEMGKDISGAGFDSKVVGRILMPLISPEPETPRIKRIIACDLTERSAGNADGVGVADFITDRLRDKINMNALHVNAMAGSEPEHARIPMNLPNDRATLEAALATIGVNTPETVKVIRIRNTKDLETIYLSEGFRSFAVQREDLTILDDLQEMKFDNDGNTEAIGG
jgi:hypothetical protein